MNKRNYFTAVLMSAILVITTLFVGCGANEEDNSGTEITTAAITTEVATEAQTESPTNDPTTEEMLTEELTEAETVTDAFTEEVPTEEISEAYSLDDAYVEYHFRNEKLLSQHFEKHGAEFEDDFGYETAADYEKGASDVINSDEALYKTEAEDGDGVYYIESTNEFVILATDGYIRTYFRPTAGINYFNRQ